MRQIYRKFLKRYGLHEQFKTEMVGDFLVTYEPSTDIGGKLYMGEMFEKDELTIASQYIKRDSTILDIGANIGLHALGFSAMANDGLVIAFEPQPKTFRTLEKNIIQNGVKNIIPLNLAIAQAPKIAEFYVMADDAYSSLIDTGRKKLTETIKVLCASVDGVLADVKVDFVKIDVEGLELNVLQSMSDQIQKHQPVIFCEIYKGNINSNNPHDTINFLRDFGYKVNRVIDGALVEFGLDDKHVDQYYNYFFVHSDKKQATKNSTNTKPLLKQ